MIKYLNFNNLTNTLNELNITKLTNELNRQSLMVGYIDAFRNINKDPHNYTWWSNRGRAWDNNVGWRIDYQMLSSTKNIKVLAANIYKKERFSDHSPLIIDYDI